MPIEPARRWILPSSAPAELLNATPEHPLLVQTLFRRGLNSPTAIADFLQTAASDTDPHTLHGVTPAVERILRALDRGEVICVYGDFDADGVTATALMVTALQAAGAQVGAYIPERVDEGYGLNQDAITRIAQKANLIVTVDCGMRSLAEVAHANALGVDVIVTDHHSIGADPLPAVAVINPRQEACTGHFPHLAGVGVAYRLAQAVLRAVAERRSSQLTLERVAEIEEELLDFVALGTVADMMPLVGENRLLVQRGLKRMRETPRLGIAALLDASSTTRAALDAQAISFRIAPRINAAGRLAHAMLAYRLLRTADAAEALKLSHELERLNRERQNLTVEAQAEAETQVAEQIAAAQQADAQQSPWIYLVQSKTIRSGIVGLVAGKLVERYYRPAIVVEHGVDESRGSARSIREFDIGAALDSVGNMLVRHGGHSRAAGFTVRSERLPDLQRALAEIATEQLSRHAALRPTLEIDAVASLYEITWGLLDQFSRLEPTGQENAQPVLMSRNVRLRSKRDVGNGKHLKLVLDGGAWGDAVQDAIAFNMGELAGRLKDGDRLDIAYAVERNDFAGARSLQLNIKDLRTAEPDA